MWKIKLIKKFPLVECAWIIGDILKVLGPWVKARVLKLSKQEESIPNFTKISVSPGSALPKPQGAAPGPNPSIFPHALKCGFQAKGTTVPRQVGPQGWHSSTSLDPSFNHSCTPGHARLLGLSLGAFRGPQPTHTIQDKHSGSVVGVLPSQRIQHIHKGRWRQILIFMNFPQARDPRCRAARHSVESFWPFPSRIIQNRQFSYIHTHTQSVLNRNGCQVQKIFNCFSPRT